jgi:hypothetical protein
MPCAQVLGAVAFLALLLTLALVREIRLRRAMQNLFVRAFFQRRNELENSTGCHRLAEPDGRAADLRLPANRPATDGTRPIQP